MISIVNVLHHGMHTYTRKEVRVEGLAVLITPALTGELRVYSPTSQVARRATHGSVPLPNIGDSGRYLNPKGNGDSDWGIVSNPSQPNQ